MPEAQAEEPELVDNLRARQILGGRMSPISRVTLWRGVRDKHYPAPVKIGRSSRWVLAELHQCIADLIAARDNEGSETSDPHHD